MAPDPTPTGRASRHPRLTDAAVQFQAGIARIAYRRMVERAMRRLEEDRRRREVVELLHLAQLVEDATAN